MHYPTDRIAHTTTFVTPIVEHWLEREIVLYMIMSHIYIVRTEITHCLYLHKHNFVLVCHCFGQNISYDLRKVYTRMCMAKCDLVAES